MQGYLPIRQPLCTLKKAYVCCVPKVQKGIKILSGALLLFLVLLVAARVGDIFDFPLSTFLIGSSYAFLCTDINSLILFCNYLTYKRDMALSYLKFNFNWGH